MPKSTRPTIRFNITLMRRDMDERGWNGQSLARAAGVSRMTVSRFFRGERQTSKTVKRLADAFGYSVRRYQREK